MIKILVLLCAVFGAFEIYDNYIKDGEWRNSLFKIKEFVKGLFKKTAYQAQRVARALRASLPQRRIRDVHFFSNEHALPDGKPSLPNSTGGAAAVNRDTGECWAWNKFTNEWVAETDEAVLNFLLGKSMTIDTTVIYPKPRGSNAVNPATGDYYDYDTIQAAINMAEIHGKRIELYGKTYWINRGLKAPKYWHFDMRGVRGAKIKTDSLDSFAMVGRDAPNDSGDANVMIQYVWRWEDIELEGRDRIQTGLRPGPTYGHGEGSRFIRPTFKALSTPMKLEFNLNARIEHPAFVDCRDGVILSSAVGLYAGATKTNSQCNNCTIVQPRYYGDSALMAAIRAEFPNYQEDLKLQYDAEERKRVIGGNGKSVIQKDTCSEILSFAENWIREKTEAGEITFENRVESGGVAIGVYDSSSVTIYKPIIEGFSVGVGIDIESNTTVVKDCAIEGGVHFECVNGAGAAAIRVRLLGGKVSVHGYFGQYPATVVDAASTGGYMELEMKDMRWAVPVNGKLFNNGGCTWEIETCTYSNGSIKPSNFANLVAGTPVAPCGGDSCGYNKFRVIDIPR